jgi:hypothetical protein
MESHCHARFHSGRILLIDLSNFKTLVEVSGMTSY